jgi:hypothetical protein
MSQAHIEQFYAIASKDQALFNRMMAGTKSPDDFVVNAVTQGKALGYSFTVEEADAWIQKQQQIKAGGELSDSQLESVAGGKGELLNQVKGGMDLQHSTVTNGLQEFAWDMNRVRVGLAEGVQLLGSKSTWTSVGNWFSSW